MFKKLMKKHPRSIHTINGVYSLFVLCFVLNSLLRMESLWNLYLIPTMLIILIRPYLSTAVKVMIVITLIKIIDIINHYQFFYQALNQIISDIATHWAIILLFTSIIVRNNNIKKDLETKIMIDPLTKLYNRRYIEHIEQILIDFGKNKTPLSLIMLDLDYFKNINDTYGHDFGDKVLVGISNIIRNGVDDSSYVVRFGGEEFLIFLPKTSLESAISIANRIRNIISRTTFTYKDGTIISVTVSSGVATLKEDETIESLFDRVDQALYKAKNNGRNQIYVQRA